MINIVADVTSTALTMRSNLAFSCMVVWWFRCASNYNIIARDRMIISMMQGFMSPCNHMYVNVFKFDHSNYD